MKFWDDYWFGPVAAVRPYLLFRGLLLFLAADLWFLQPAPTALIGMYGFDVSHFAWLDLLQPLPTPEFKFAVIMLTGFAAAVTSITGSRVLVIAVVLLFSYSWAMSMQDILQHHYFLSLSLLCIACLPKVRASDIWALSIREGRGGAREGPRTSAFGFVLLGVTIGIVYFFAAVTKMQEEWLRGASLVALSATNPLGGINVMVEPVERLLDPLGVGVAAVWATVGHGSVIVELLLAVCYFTAVWRDRARPGLKLWWLVSGATPIAVHTIFLNMNLRIGWFTYYMYFMAFIFFFPERWLLGLGRWITWPVLWVQVHVSPRIASGARGGRVAAVALIVGIAVVVSSLRMDIPGSLATGLVPAVCLLGLTTYWIIRGRPARTVVWLFATAVSGVAMIAIVLNSHVRFLYYSHRIDYVIETGSREAALAALARYERYAPADFFHAHERLGDLTLRLGLADEAVVHLRRAAELEPDHAATLNNLAWILAQRGGGDAREAVSLARRAVRATERSDADVLDTLAFALAADSQFNAAIAAAKDAIEVASAEGSQELVVEISERLREYESAEGRAAR